LKRLIAKVPLGKTRIATIAAALMLLRSKPTAKKVQEDYVDELFNLEEELLKTMKEVESVMEDGAATNSVASGSISGLGSPPDVVVVPKKAAERYKKKNKADIIMGVVKRKL
jgi:hypothetical protein